MEVEGFHFTIEQLDALKKLRSRTTKEIADGLDKIFQTIEWEDKMDRVVKEAITNETYHKNYFNAYETEIYNKVLKYRNQCIEKYGKLLTVEEIETVMFDMFDD